jgi:putative ribosome biogenesis GTPase RsgA
MESMLKDSRMHQWEIQNKHLGTAGESRPMTAAIKPSYKNKALHETLSTRKALEKKHIAQNQNAMIIHHLSEPSLRFSHIAK